MCGNLAADSESLELNEAAMSLPNRPLIVGAGPVGLGAALFLARQGLVTRVVELRDEPARESKALAVNPRTLDILEPTGVTQRMLELGSPVRGVCFRRREQIFGSLSLTGIHPKYPFMLGLSQAATERLLADALCAVGGSVERGVKLVECRVSIGQVEAVLESAAADEREVVACPWLLAADGAHSATRQQLGVSFEGSAFASEWYLTDVPLRTELAADQVHIFFLDAGELLFMMPVVDPDLRSRIHDPVWRVISNRPEPLSRLIQAEQAGSPIWTSHFRIAHRIAGTLATQNVYFAGDAAHVHSPVGARGMNLGLEDAWIFSELVRTNRLQEYDGMRRRVDRRVVRQVEFLSRVASPESWFFRLMRSYVFPTAIKIPFLHSRMLATVAGLDHKLPVFNGH
ncbi:MAG: 2-polyprenyl-6-methoxyphenol hydroxylase [Planctomycetaceae bacterium]|nr:2-polyprenyl-6-methoxyphenol hydroxylase [Planctomycetaceae bacterium]